jgi:outer membrane receptor protein involved in Fe transport
VVAVSLVAHTAWAQTVPSAATVRAQRRPTWDDPADSLNSATSIDLTERGRLASGVGALLDDAPGLHVRRNGGDLAAETLVLRGAPAAHLTVALDGVVLNDAASDGVDLSVIPPALIARVDVYRGVVPVRLGVGSLGGAVDLRLRDLSARPVAWAAAGAGSFGGRRASAGAGAGLGAWRTLVALNYRGTSGDFSYYQPDARTLSAGRVTDRVNNGGDALDGLFRVCRGGPEARTSACLLVLGGWLYRGIAGPGDAAVVGPFQEQRRLLARASFDWRPEAWTIELAATAMVRGDLFDGRGTTGGVSVTGYRATSDTWRGQAELRARRRSSGVTHEALLRGRAEGFVPGAGATLVDATRRALTAGLESTWATGGLRLSAGFVAEAIADETPSQHESRGLLSPRVGAHLRVRPWLELRAHAGIAARAPTLPERFGDRGVIVGNASLRAERSRFVDAAAVLTARRGRWRLDAELGGYARDATDLIALVQVGPGRFRAENFGRVSIVGAELSARVRWRDELTLTVAGALLDPALVGEGGDRGRMVPGVPWGDLSATLAMAVGGARAALSVSAVSSAWLDRSNCTAIPARALADLRLGWSPPVLRGWGATLEVTNLFDQRTASQGLCNPIGDASSVTAPIQDFLGYPLPGRAVFGGVVYEVR